MKNTNISENQIIGYLRRIEGEKNVRLLCHEAVLSQGMRYHKKSKYSGMKIIRLKKHKCIPPVLSVTKLGKF